MALLSPDDQRAFNDPELRLVTVTGEQTARAAAQLGTCEECDASADIPFDWVVREVVEEKGYVDYILPMPVKCPKCGASIIEKTLVGPIGGIEVDALVTR